MMSESIRQSSTKAVPDDETEILKILGQFVEAFDKRDAELYAASFSEDADWENAFGGRARGRAEIRDFVRRVYPLFRSSSQESGFPIEGSGRLSSYAKKLKGGRSSYSGPGT